MAKRIHSLTTLTPTATADATPLASATFMGAIQGGTATQRIVYYEIFMGGQATSSAPSIMLFSRDSTVGITPSLGTGENDASMDASTAALAAAALNGNTWATPPQRSSSLHLMNLSFNAFGGIIRWVPAPGCEPSTIGNTASLGEVSLSAFTGGTTGLMGSHIIYEPA